MVGQVDLLLAAEYCSTAATDAVYVMFQRGRLRPTARLPLAWSSVWHLLSAFAVISYTENLVYVVFRGAGLVDWRLSIIDASAKLRRAPIESVKAGLL